MAGENTVYVQQKQIPWNNKMYPSGTCGKKQNADLNNRLADTSIFKCTTILMVFYYLFSNSSHSLHNMIVILKSSVNVRKFFLPFLPLHTVEIEQLFCSLWLLYKRSLKLYFILLESILGHCLKVPKCEIFHLFDFNDFCGIKSV